MRSDHRVDKFELAERLEAEAARIYRLLAELFEHDAKAVELFNQLAAEEDQHGTRIKMLKNRYLHNQKAFHEIKMDRDRVGELIEEARSIRRMLTEGALLTYDEAINLMVNLEERFAEVHAQNMAISADPTLREIFEILASQDRQHAALLAKQRRA